MDKEKFILDFIKNSERYYIEDDERINIPLAPNIKLEDIVFYRIDKITFEDKAPNKDALENVLSSIRIKGVNFLYLIKGDRKGVSFYYGIVRDVISKLSLSYNIKNLGDMILKPGLESNFRGSKVSKVGDEESEKIINKLSNMNFIKNIDGVPGINGEDNNYQGVDRMVDVMLGNEFIFLVTAKVLSRDIIRYFENKIYNFYNGLIPYSKKNIQTGKNEGKTTIDTIAIGTNDSTSESNQEGKTTNYGHSTQKGTSKTTRYDGVSKVESQSVTSNKNASSKNTSNTTTHQEGHSENRTTGKNRSEGTTVNTNYEYVNKEVQEWIKYIDEVLLKRLDYGKGKGMYISTISLFTMKEPDMIKLENTVTALFSGQSGNKVPLRTISLEKNGHREMVLRNFQIPIANFMESICKDEIDTRTILSQYVSNEKAYLGNWFSVKELSIIAGLPQKEIVGLALREEVEFGLNYNVEIQEKNRLLLGNLIQSGNVLNIPVVLDRRELNKHTFVTGVTGSGKTTTCQKILIQSNIPFLVIEPAKTEYRILTKKYDDILIFTLGKDKIAPFRLNPLEFYPHESITSHVDMIMASIESAFDMEAAIPQIIEKSLYECYKDYGWDISDDTNKYYSNDDIANGKYAFPTLSDLIDKTEETVKKQGFDIRLQSDYIGSIKARLQGLTIGSKGLMLNTRRSLDFRDLIHKRVILELEEIRNGSEKALIMGFILSNLMEAIKAEYKKNTEFKHITLVEEAHRLLGRYEPGDSLTKKQGIEMFSNMLAEVRKYGESLVIVDQIPSKLAPDVVKNTNTKIVHKIFAQDDKDVIGNTMALSDEQKDFLSFLDKGRAIIFSQGWDSSLQIQINPETDTGNKEIINEDIIRDRTLEYYCDKFYLGIYSSLKYCESRPTKELFLKHLKYRNDLDDLIKIFNELIGRSGICKFDIFKNVILNLENILSVEQQAKYIGDYIYTFCKDEKLKDISSLLTDIKNDKFDKKDIVKYNYLSYGRREKYNKLSKKGE